MSDLSIPVEILEQIFQDLISDYTKSLQNWEILPRWYIVPLLRVCKLWHLVGERFLYRSISIGGSDSGSGPRRSDELVRTLKANPRLATLIKELYLRSITKPWAAINTQLVDICPNLRGLNMRGVHSSEVDSLLEVLKKKSLVSFRFVEDEKYTSLPIFDLMQSWPHIQMIGIFGEYVKLDEHPQASRALNCCPELRRMFITPAFLNEHGFASLRLMCSVMTVLEVRFRCPDTEVLDAFCGCLHAWSPTLEYLKITMVHGTSSYRPLLDAISSLTSLQELDITDVLVNFGAISSFPRLKRLLMSARCPDPKAEEDRLAYLLRDPEKFAALIDMQLFLYSSTGQNPIDKRMLQDVCYRRNIALQTW